MLSDNKWQEQNCSLIFFRSYTLLEETLHISKTGNFNLNMCDTLEFWSWSTLAFFLKYFFLQWRKNPSWVFLLHTHIHTHMHKPPQSKQTQIFGNKIRLRGKNCNPAWFCLCWWTRLWYQREYLAVYFDAPQFRLLCWLTPSSWIRDIYLLHYFHS